MKIRLLTFLVILVLAAGMVPAVAAQDQAAAQQLNCLDLSKDDCAIVQGALDNLSKMDSFTPSVTLSVAVAGADAVAPGMGLDSSTDIKASGAVVIDRKAMTAATPYKGVSVSFDVSGKSNFGGKDQPVDVSFVMVDGNMYWSDKGTWQGVAIDDMVKYFKNGGTLPNNMSFMGMSLPPAMMSGMMGQMGQIGANPAAAAGSMNLGGKDLSTLLQIPGLLKQERLADDTSMGSTMQVFAFTGDIGAALKSADVQKAIGDAVSSAAGSGAQAGGASGQMAAMIPVLLESTTGTVTVTRWIGADDHFLHQVSLVVDASMDLFGGTTTSSKATPIPPITLKLSVTVNLDKINATTAPTAPAGATMVSPQDLFPSAESTPESTPAQ